MGIFDIFKVKNNLDGILDTLYCTNRNEWTDGYKNKNPTELIKKSKSLKDQKFFEYLKKRPRYLEITNHLEISDGVSKIECSGDVKGYHFGLGETEKRKAYPINRYNSFFGFRGE